jgi:hypothetical protein
MSLRIKTTPTGLIAAPLQQHGLPAVAIVWTPPLASRAATEGSSFQIAGTKKACTETGTGL